MADEEYKRFRSNENIIYGGTPENSNSTARKAYMIGTQTNYVGSDRFRQSS